MKPKLFLAVGIIILLMSARAYSTDGNRTSQEVADVVFRQMDNHLNPHSGIYIGQTNKDEPSPSDPINHTVIEMAGIPNKGIFLLWITSAAGIGFANFDGFRVSHPKYFGAYTAYKPFVTDPLERLLSLSDRKKILNIAQLLRDVRPSIKYIVIPGDRVDKLVDNYFQAGVNDAGVNLADYTGDYAEVTRMRSDAFVEYCYSYAGVPIARTDSDVPVYITTKAGAVFLVAQSGILNLFPSKQREWMYPSLIDNPKLIAKDSNGVPITSEIPDSRPVYFDISDESSGPGIPAGYRLVQQL